MVDEKKHLEKLDKPSEHAPGGDKALKSETITNKSDNSLQERQKTIDAARSYKLTGEGQLPFRIQGLDGDKVVDVKDSRPQRSGISALGVAEAHGVTEKSSQSEDRANGDVVEVRTVKNADGSIEQTSTHSNGDAETLKTDSQGREVERSNSHIGPLGRVIDEKRSTNYDTPTGWPQAVTTHFDRSGRELEQISEDSFGNSHIESYNFGTDGKKFVSTVTDIDRTAGTRIDTTFDAEHHPIETIKVYADGRPPDCETWSRGFGNVVIHEKNGQDVIDSDHTFPPRDDSVAESIGGLTPLALASSLGLRAGDGPGSGNGEQGKASATESTPGAIERHLERISNKSGSDNEQGNKKLDDWADAQSRDIDRRIHELQTTNSDSVGKNELNLLKKEKIQLERFKQDIHEFEKRGKLEGLKPEEILATLAQIEKLTFATGEKPLTSTERRHFAEQILHQCAFPKSIDQGHHNTCTVAAIESRTYTRTPSEATRLVVDLAVTGHYESSQKDASGKPAVTLDMVPKAHDESKHFPTTDKERSFASEIFQVAAVNLYYQQENKIHGTHIEYVQNEPGKHDTGEILIDSDTKKPRLEYVLFGDPIRDPHLMDDSLGRISHLITGLDEGENVEIVNGANFVGNSKLGTMTVINSKEELAAKLEKLKTDHKFPVLLRVNPECDPFYIDSENGYAGGSIGSHAVCITGYDERTGRVFVDNQWGRAKDHGPDQPIELGDLYIATLKTHDAIERLRIVVAQNNDPLARMELLRLELTESPKDGKIVEEARKTLREMEKQFSGISLDGDSAQSEALMALITHMPMLDRIQFLAEGYSLDVFKMDQFEAALVQAGIKSELAHKHGWSLPFDNTYEKERLALENALDLLPDCLKDYAKSKIQRGVDDE
jgi:hypothetical protein